MARYLKKLLFGTTRAPRRVRFGLYRGLTLNINPNGDLAYVFGTYEIETHAWLRKAASASRSFVDVGAGNGELVAWALSKPGMESVVAYEAMPERCDLMRSNVALNGFTDDPRLTIVCGEFLSAATRSADLRTVEKLPEPILFKMDIDGGEADVLRHLEELMARKKMHVLIETHSRDLDAACLQLLSQAGYHARQVPQSRLRILLPERRPLDFNQWITASNPG